jgi:DNA-binding NarL/FixJ family response regulator
VRTTGSENGTSEPVRVFPLDDHEIVRRGVRDTLEADIKVIGEQSHPKVMPQPGIQALLLLLNGIAS